ncbi:MAG TPA: glycerophosphodiester phosphodiesterase family protein [Pirellulaceae bacterium]|nr:glycerophosphodiester phosphodiesterase family protein [Pirellulaceae bacterium]
MLPAIPVSLANPASAAEATPAQKLIALPQVLVIAHRGNSSVAPENTLPAFQSALDAKADLVELDYFHSADGVPVVIHDQILDRTTNAEDVLGRPKLVVGDWPLADLRKLDVGSWFDDKFAGTKFPTLAESLDLIQSRSVTLIERKAGNAAALVRLLEEKNLIDQVAVQSFDWTFVAECRRLSPRLVLGTLSGKPANPEQIRAAAATGADLIVWDHEKIGRREIALIHELGKKAWAYTIDDPQRATQLIAAGLDGIITNKPAEMLKLRDRSQGTGIRSQPSPSPQP